MLRVGSGSGLTTPNRVLQEELVLASFSFWNAHFIAQVHYIQYSWPFFVKY